LSHNHLPFNHKPRRAAPPTVPGKP